MSVDPIFHAYQSPYVGFDNNPIFFTDPNGTTVEKDNKGMYAGYRNHVNLRLSEAKTKANKLQTQVNEGKKIKPEKLAGAQELVAKLEAVNTELDQLEQSSTVYKIDVTQLGKPGRAGGRISYDNTNNKIIVSLYSINPNSNYEELSHELKHAYQYETGKT